MAVMVLMSAVLTSCVIRTGAHRGKQVTRNLRVSDFERIHITGNFDVVYEQGDSLSVCVEGKERLIEASDIRVEDAGGQDESPQRNGIPWSRKGDCYHPRPD